FQAEDGIRYGHVTGVQTCALPISRLRLDGEPPEQEVGLREPGGLRDQTEQHAACAIVRLLLNLVAREREVGFLRIRVQRDDPLRSEERRVGKAWRSGREAGRGKRK